MEKHCRIAFKKPTSLRLLSHRLLNAASSSRTIRTHCFVFTSNPAQASRMNTPSSPSPPIQKGFFTPAPRGTVFFNLDGFQYQLKDYWTEKEPKPETAVRWTCRFDRQCSTRIFTVSRTDPTIQMAINKPHTCRPSETPVQEGLETVLPINYPHADNALIQYRGQTYSRIQGSQTDWICHCTKKPPVDGARRCTATITTKSVDDLTVVRRSKFSPIFF